MKRLFTLFSLMLMALTAAWAQTQTAVRVTNVPDKYEGWEACVIAISSSQKSAEGLVTQMKVMFVTDAFRETAKAATWAEFYQRAAAQTSTVLGNKVELSSNSSDKISPAHIILGFAEDGFVCGGEIELVIAENVTRNEDGSYDVTSVPEPYTSVKLRSDDAKPVDSDDATIARRHGQADI